jgi:RNA polymerase sigma-70 factor, ECF subfamily
LSKATDWAAVVGLYDALAALTHSPVALLNRSAAIAEAGDVDAALLACEQLRTELGDYQPWWALRAHLLERAGRIAEARAAYGEAAAREHDAAVVRFLKEKSARLPATVETTGTGASAARSDGSAEGD